MNSYVRLWSERPRLSNVLREGRWYFQPLSGILALQMRAVKQWDFAQRGTVWRESSIGEDSEHWRFSLRENVACKCVCGGGGVGQQWGRVQRSTGNWALEWKGGNIKLYLCLLSDCLLICGLNPKLLLPTTVSSVSPVSTILELPLCYPFTMKPYQHEVPLTKVKWGDLDKCHPALSEIMLYCGGKKKKVFAFSWLSC